MALHSRQASGGSDGEGLQGFKLHVSPVQTPFVVLFEQHGADRTRNGRVVGEDTYDFGAALDLGVEPLQRVGDVYLQPVRTGEGHGRQHFVLGAVHQRTQLGQLASQLICDRAPLRMGGLGTVLGEDGGDGGADHAALGLVGMRQGVAHEVHPAALPGGLEYLGRCGLQPEVGVGSQTDLIPARQTLFPPNIGADKRDPHSTVTLLARLRGLSTSVPRAQAVW